MAKAKEAAKPKAKPKRKKAKPIAISDNPAASLALLQRARRGR